MKFAYFIGVYLVERSYGGPEEGGWWYNSGSSVTLQDLLDDGYPETGPDPVQVLILEGPEPFRNEPVEDPDEDYALQDPILNPESEKKLKDTLSVIQKALDEGPNKDRRPIHSVLSTGRYRVEAFPNRLPQHFPEKRPRYE